MTLQVLSATAAAHPGAVVYDQQGRALSISRDVLRDIFFMRVRTWPDGTPIHVFVLPDTHPLHAEFAKQVLGVYPYQLRTAWDRQVYSGTGFAPTVVDNVEEMRARLAHTPGSIGYLTQ